MPQIINSNIASLTAQRNLNTAQSDNAQALNRLSSGLRINSAKDDAAGIAISTRFDSQIQGLNVATRNAGDGVSLAQTAEGGLDSMTTSLQRLRELAVQSSNATNSDVDRSALNEEAQQLISEIERVSEETNFNGVKLLNGDFKDATFQVGANQGETIDVSVGKVTVDTLGAGSTGGLSSTATDNALQNGDLYINGTEVKGSSSSDDNASTDNASASAIAKAAAINKVSDETGVTASVNTNTVGGSAQTAGAAASGTVTLNGVAIDVTVTTDEASTRAAVTEAINAESLQTGITAINSGEDGNGVTLQAEDGRNIELDLGTLTAANTGLAAETTYEGSFTLVSESEFTIDGGDGAGFADLSNSGLVAGTYEGGTSALVSESVTAKGEDTLGRLNSGSFANTVGAAASKDTAEIISYSATVDGVATGTPASLAAGTNTAEFAAAIDGLSTDIEAYEEIKLTFTEAAAIGADGLNIGGIALGADFGLAAEAADIADAINATDYSAGSFDVEATVTGTTVDLKIRNYSGDELVVQSDTADIALSGGSSGTIAEATATVAAGELVVNGTDNQDVSVTLTEAENTSGEIFAGDTATFSSTGLNTLDSGDLTINGVSINAADPADDTASSDVASDGYRILSSDKGASAISIAAAINKASGETGVTATADATTVVGGEIVTQNEANAFESGDQAGIYINGQNLGSVSLVGDGTDIDFEKARTDAVSLINGSSGQTGVTAEDNGSSITLTATDGRNISVAIDDQSGESSSIGQVIGLDAAEDGIGEATFSNANSDAGTTTSSEALAYETTAGKISLSAAGSFDVGAGANGKAEVEALGLEVGTFGGASSGTFLKDVDLSTVAGSNAALEAVDNALQTVNTERAKLGAVQNRFEATITSNTLTSENLSAANSRIRDADFAAETAALSRSQVLQQAGISILAQANALPQQALSLLG
jgi:flagellin